MKFPHLITNFRNKVIFFFIGGFSTLVFYQISNRIHLFEPQLLHFDVVDHYMPFLPWTIWVYMTEYVIFICAYFSLRDSLNITKYFYSYMATLLVSLAVFIIYPVAFPRMDFPLDQFPETLSTQMLGFLRNHLDTPANCLPSLHVSTCYVSAFALWPENKKLFGLFFLWSTLVAISTMTTKQHYFVDVWTAFLLTLFFSWLFFNKVEYR